MGTELEALRDQTAHARKSYRAISQVWLSKHGQERVVAWKARQKAQREYFALQSTLALAEDGEHAFSIVPGEPHEYCLCGAHRKPVEGTYAYVIL